MGAACSILAIGVITFGLSPLKLGVTPVAAQDIAAADTSLAPAELVGDWTYRSFRNVPEPAGNDPAAWLALRFAEATFTFRQPSGSALAGEIDWGSGGLDLTGEVTSAADGTLAVSLVGMGRAGTQTDGWRYDYQGWLIQPWPGGVDQVPAIVGSVIRVEPHGGAAAGYVASFIAVKLQQ